MSKRTKTVVATAVAGLVWATAVTGGLCYMLNYERTPGSTGSVPSAWPAGSSITRATDKPTLLVFAHPRCPCTRATIAELAQLIAQIHGKVQTCVVFFRPPNSDADWRDTDLEQSAAAIPGVTVLSDGEGLEAKRFGAETSGHAMLFGAAGQLLFDGGITASRGHAGDNEGESAIASIVNGHRAAQSRTLVFGCSIVGREGIAQNAGR